MQIKDMTITQDVLTAIPTATSSTVGGVKINGNNLSVDAEGTLIAGGIIEESDPIFTNWVSGESIIAGSGFTKLGDYGQVVSIGPNMQISGTCNVTIGCSNVNNGDETVVIGTGSVTTNFGNPRRAVAIGARTAIYGYQAVAIGGDAEAYENAVGIGGYAYAQDNQAIAIGNFAHATSEKAIQLGTGTNNLSSTFQVFDYKMMDENGNIPRERMGNVLSTVSEYDWQTLSASADPQIIYFIY